jgi:hypothetical protein
LKSRIFITAGQRPAEKGNFKICLKGRTLLLYIKFCLSGRRHTCLLSAGNANARPGYENSAFQAVLLIFQSLIGIDNSIPLFIVDTTLDYFFDSRNTNRATINLN